MPTAALAKIDVSLLTITNEKPWSEAARAASASATAVPQGIPRGVAAARRALKGSWI